MVPEITKPDVSRRGDRGRQRLLGGGGNGVPIIAPGINQRCIIGRIFTDVKSCDKIRSTTHPQIKVSGLQVERGQIRLGIVSCKL